MKARYARPGDEFEVPLEGYVVDIRRPDMLVEVQTTSFGAMGRKFDRLLDQHRILLVHPIAIETYVQRPGRKARKSPERGSMFELFVELVSIPSLLDHPNLSLEVLLVSVTKVQEPVPRSRGNRAGYRTLDRQLREVFEVRRFSSAADLAALLPSGLPPRFTTADIATRAQVPRDVAQRMAFCYRALEVFTEVGRIREGILYSLTGLAGG